MRTRWLGWLVAASAAATVGCPGPSGNDGGDVQMGGDAQDVVRPDAQDDVQGMDVQGVDVQGDDVQGDVQPDAPVVMTRTTPTQGSAMAISADDTVAVATNRTAHSVSVFNVSAAATPPTVARVGMAISTGPNSEPWAAVISNDGNTAYVILRRDRAVVQLTNLHGVPALGARAVTGSEPTGIAISPSGRRLFVANWAEGTVTVVNTADMTVASTVDLNPSLLAAGVLGPSVTASRPALAHPRAIVVTNNGDANDDDETVYVSEFFSQARTDAVPADDSGFDIGRQGIVYRFNLGTQNVAAPITIAPVANTGFPDSNNAVTGCFPNQLNALAINNGRLYVNSVCESPRGPTGPVTPAGMPTDVRNFKTQIHAAIFTVDIATNAEVPAQRVLLTQQFQTLYDAAVPAIPDNATRRMPLITNDIAFAPMSNIAYLTSYGSDAVFRVQFRPDGTVERVGAPAANFINLAPGGGVDAGRLPIGIAIANTVQFAFVANQHSRNVSTLSFTTQATAMTAAASADTPTGTEAEANDGQRFFVTGLGRWSLRGQGWNSCETCHPDGLTDNVTWFFARGPRQTTSLDATYSPDGARRRILNWTAIFDEVHDFELNTRGNSGGVGAIVRANSMPPVADDRIIFDGTPVTGMQVATATPQAGLSGSTRSLMPGGATMPNSVLGDWDAIDRYVKSIRSPRAPTNLNPADVAAGLALFQGNNCAGCHGTDMWTISRVFYDPNEVNNNPMTGRLRAMMYMAPAAFPAALNPPSSGAGRIAPYRFPAGPTAGANDQINCVLRAVGTIPAMLDGMQNGIVVTGAPRVREVRADMMALAQGATGFNPPSLLGMVTGAPYFHAGNARTLEELFDTTFRQHYQAHSTNFLDTGDRAAQIRQMVAFLLSVDDSTTAVPVPTAALGFNPDLCGTL